MPLTFLSHQAVVLPLKIKAPDVMNGTALVLGSMAPDVEYLLRGYPTGTIGHTWMGLLTFCVPVTLALFWIVTRVVARPVAAHLPEGGDFHLPGYGLVVDQPRTARHWAIVALSALIGSASHVVLDRLSGGWSSQAPALFGSWIPFDALPSSRAWAVAKITTWIVLAIATLMMMRYIGRRRLLERWTAQRAARHASGEAAPSTPSERVSRNTHPGSSDQSRFSLMGFWTWTIGAALIGAGLGAWYRRPGFFLHQPATWVHIWLCSVSGAFIGLVLASAAWHFARVRSVQLRGSQQ